MDWHWIGGLAADWWIGGLALDWWIGGSANPAANPPILRQPQVSMWQDENADWQVGAVSTWQA